MKGTKKRKAQKGDAGYFKNEKVKRTLITLGMFAIPLFIFFTAWAYNKTRTNLWTVVAIVGCIPACKSLLGLIMMLGRKPISQDLYEKIKSHSGTLVMSYEMYMTFYEKSAYIDAFAICGNNVVGYSSDPKIDAPFMEKESRKILESNGYKKINVKIMKDLRPFLERLDSMNEHQESLREGIAFTPDERYPDLSRDELIKHTILAICL